MNVYLVRHGESEGNLKNLHQSPEMLLTEEGKRQVIILSKRLKNIPINIIYSSPFARARQTAEIISGELKLPIEYWESLKERKRPSEIFGLKTNDPRAVRINTLISTNWPKGGWKYSDDETFEELKGRAEEVLEHLLKKHKKQNILCVSHGTIMRMIASVAIFGKDLAPDLFWKFNKHTSSGNTGITHLEYLKGGLWKLVSWNDTAHL